MSNTNTEVWGNIELPNLSDEELFTKNWASIARNRERNKNPDYWKNLEKGLQKRNNSSWKENKANAIRKSFANPEYRKSCKELQRKLRGYPVCAIDPNGKEYKFNSVAECSEFLGNPLLQSRPRNYFAEDGSKYISQRRKWKGWTFFRIL